MRLLKILPLLLFSYAALANNIEAHFATIKSNPKALYAFFKAMPKGGELHYHLAGGAYPEAMLALATKNDYCLNLKTQAISKNIPCEGIKTTELANKPELHTDIIRAWSLKGFIPKLQSNHDHFFESFFKFIPIVSDFPSQLLAKVIERAANQHELYLEIMLMPDNGNATTFDTLASSSNDYAEKQRILLANKNFQKNLHYTVTESHAILQKTLQELGCDQNPKKDVCSVTVKFQYYILREQSLDKVFAQALNAFAAASISKDIVGVNLVQAEDGAISLRDYQQQMQIFKFLHEAYPNVNIALHAGELATPLVSATELRSHIHDAIFTGHAQRIGHGIDITHETGAGELLKYMAKTPIPVEINLTSNRKLLNIAGKQHPLNDYLEYNVPVVLSTDDEGILRTNLTHEYVNAVMKHHLDYAAIKMINRNALTYSFLPGKSLWADASKHEPVLECQHLSSPSCQQFTNNNKKASLQWQLEKKLALFESTFE